MSQRVIKKKAPYKIFWMNEAQVKEAYQNDLFTKHNLLRCASKIRRNRYGEREEIIGYRKMFETELS